MLNANRGGPKISKYVKKHDYMHLKWKYCLVALKGQYIRGDHEKLTVMLEAVASHDL